MAFGRSDSPPAELADAVAASCAIPGFYHPVEIDGRRYVDGGLFSTSNLDIVTRERLDLVICLNPTSSLHPARAWNPAEWISGAIRGTTGRQLGGEARILREMGTHVVLVQPTREDLDAMGPNLMSRRNRQRTIEVAQRTVAEQLREPDVQLVLGDLPAGRPEKVRRPSTPPAEWPDLLDLAGLQRA